MSAAIRVPRVWEPLVGQMSQVQRLVHLAMRWVGDDQRAIRNKLFQENRYSYEMALRQEIMDLGCPDPGRLYLSEGPELKALAERAEFSAKSIVNTYNYDLARAIIAIGQDVPTANRYVYAHRLEQWQRARAVHKDAEINDTELSWSINAAKKDFYQRNVIEGPAEVVPYPTVCAECAEYVANNPYESMEELYRQCTLPLHVRCPHTGAIILSRALSKEECAQLWRG